MEEMTNGDYKILIAEDDPVSRRILEAMLKKWGYRFFTAADGDRAWEIIRAEQPNVVLLDWMMPGIDGPTLCGMIREQIGLSYIYVILLTIRDKIEDRIAGLEAGADDYVTKPYDGGELRSRIKVGCRIVELERELAQRIRTLEETLAQVKQLQGLLPICSYCKKVRDDRNYWQQVESYVTDHSEVRFSHGICPDCYARHIVPAMQKVKRDIEAE